MYSDRPLFRDLFFLTLGWVFALATLLLGVNIGRSQQLTPSEAIDLAAQLNPQPGDIFVWTDGSDTSRQAWAFVANSVLSHTANPVVPEFHGQILRVNLLATTPRPKDRERLVFILHKAGQDDPYLRDLTIPAVALEGIEIIGLDGKTYTKSERPIAKHLGPAYTTLEAIRSATGLRDCFFHGGYLLARLSRQTKNGLYYDSRGIDSDLEGYLRDRGLDWALSRTIGAESRAYISRSGVTGKPRLVVLLFGQGVAPHVGPQTIGITLDLTDEDLADPTKHPLLNLRDFRGSAAEVFVTLPNGLVETTIWDGNWKLAQTVPDNVAADTTIPEPHTRRLEPFHSCIRCHGPHEFWQPLEAHRLTLGLLSGRSIEETDANIFAFSAGPMERALDMARNTSNTAAFLAVRGEVDPASSAAKTLAAAHSVAYARYMYDQITPEVACQELGIDAGSDTPAGDVLNSLLPPGPIYDPRLQLLLSGQAISRDEWEAVLHEALVLSGPGRERLLAEKIE